MTADVHVGALLEQLASAQPERLALLEPSGARCTFGELASRVQRFSGALDGWGVRPGGHVMLLVPMGIDLYTALLGILWGGRVAVLVDPSADKQRIDQALRRVGVDAFVGTGKAHLLRLLMSSLRGLDCYVAASGWVPLAHGFPREASPGPRRLPPDGEPALITFTTGTTGVPKAIGRSHHFLLAQHRVLADHMGLSSADIDLPTLPVFLLNSLAAGATCVLPDGDLRDVAGFEPRRLAAQIRDHGVTTSSGSPAFYQRLAEDLIARGETLPEVKTLFVGGARVQASLLQTLRTALPEARVEVVYGSTEAEPIASITADDVLGKTAAAEAAGQGSCVGRPVPGIAVRLVDPDDGTEVTDGQPGEVQVAGDHVNTGYYRDPDADAANKVRDGERIWHRTGDGAWRDEQGRLWLVGRISERVGGRYPFRVEAKAEALAGVQRAALVAVAGVPVVGFVGTADEAGVAACCGVERAVRVDEMPVDPRHRAKVDRLALATRLAGR